MNPSGLTALIAFIQSFRYCLLVSVFRLLLAKTNRYTNSKLPSTKLLQHSQKNRYNANPQLYKISVVKERHHNANS